MAQGSNDVLERCSHPLYKLPVMAAVHVGSDAKVSNVMQGLARVSPRTALLDTKSGAMHGGTGEAFDWRVSHCLEDAAVPAVFECLMIVGGTSGSIALHS